jgi:outer membrane immunogenic protein
LPLKSLTFQSLLRFVAGVVAVVGLAIATPAQAQDRWPWTGFYAGIHGGYHWGGGGSFLSLEPSVANWTSLSPDYGQFHGRYDSSPDGFLGGGQLGYNWRSGTFVVGLEADISRSDADGQKSHSALVTEGLDTFPVAAFSRQEMDWFGTVRGRVGVMPLQDRRLLVYVTAGLAYARVRTAHTIVDIDLQSGFAGTSSDWEVGGTVGAGLEWGIGGAWTLKAEYLYYDLGDRRVEGANFNNASPLGFDARYDLSGHIARVGVNYQIGGY